MKILVVDDEPLICELVELMLSDRHCVQTVTDSVRAAERVRTEPWDLVITDRAMPKLNGMELAATVKQFHPSTPVILMTGYAAHPREHVGDIPNVDSVLPKPFRGDDVRRLVCRLSARSFPGNSQGGQEFGS